MVESKCFRIFSSFFMFVAIQNLYSKLILHKTPFFSEWIFQFSLEFLKFIFIEFHGYWFIRIILNHQDRLVIFGKSLISRIKDIYSIIKLRFNHILWICNVLTFILFMWISINRSQICKWTGLTDAKKAHKHNANYYRINT